MIKTLFEYCGKKEMYEKKEILEYTKNFIAQ